MRNEREKTIGNTFFLFCVLLLLILFMFLFLKSLVCCCYCLLYSCRVIAQISAETLRGAISLSLSLFKLFHISQLCKR